MTSARSAASAPCRSVSLATTECSPRMTATRTRYGSAWWSWPHCDSAAVGRPGEATEVDTRLLSDGVSKPWPLAALLQRQLCPVIRLGNWAVGWGRGRTLDIHYTAALRTAKVDESRTAKYPSLWRPCRNPGRQELVIGSAIDVRGVARACLSLRSEDCDAEVLRSRDKGV